LDRKSNIENLLERVASHRRMKKVLLKELEKNIEEIIASKYGTERFEGIEQNY